MSRPKVDIMQHLQSNTLFRKKVRLGNNSVLCNSVLGNSVLGNSVLGNSVLGNSVLGNSVLGNSVLGNVCTKHHIKEKKHEIDKQSIMKKFTPTVSKGLTISFEIELSIGGKVLIVPGNILTLKGGHKYGLIGRNGLGKSLLLDYIVKESLKKIEEYPTDDNRRKYDVLCVSQELPISEMNPIDTILRSNTEINNILTTIETIQSNSNDLDNDRLNELYDILDTLDIDYKKSEIAMLLCGLGFNNSEISSKPVSTWSGGWRMRMAIARAIYYRPSVLILDEPTNHLDFETNVWLGEYLGNIYKGTILVVSHDQGFLDEFVDSLIILKHKNLTCYNGNYSLYLNDQNVGNTHKFEKNFDIYQENKELSFSFSQCGGGNTPVPIKFRDVSFTYPNSSRETIKNIDMGVGWNDRIALVGKNGTGKSTLIKLLAGELKPTTGIIEVDPHLRVAIFHQHHIDQLDYNLSVLDYFTSNCSNNKKINPRQHLAKFGLIDKIPLQKIITLSGGQKTRLILACLAWNEPHFILLDEPTNHLDLETISALVSALKTYDGGVVIISHNQHLISQVCKELWIINNGIVSRFEGDITTYKSQLLKNFTT